MIPGIPSFMAGKLSMAAVDLLRKIYRAESMTVPRLTGAPFQLMSVRLITAPMADDFHQKHGYRIEITALGRTVGKALAELDLAHG